MDEYMQRTMSTFAFAERKTHYNEVQRIMAEQQPMIYTVTPYIFVCAREGIGNLKPTLSRHRTLWNADELYWR